MNTDVKSGYKTTEFWLPIVKLFVGLLVTAGILLADAGEGEVLAQLLAAALVACVALYSAGQEVVQYINGRSLLKKQSVRAGTDVRGRFGTEEVAGGARGMVVEKLRSEGYSSK